MTKNTNQLRKDLEELKAKRETSNKKDGILIFEEYHDGELSYEEAMALLDKEDYVFGDVARVLIRSGHYDDETKRKMMNG